MNCMIILYGIDADNMITLLFFACIENYICAVTDEEIDDDLWQLYLNFADYWRMGAQHAIG